MNFVLLSARSVRSIWLKSTALGRKWFKSTELGFRWFKSIALGIIPSRQFVFRIVYRGCNLARILVRQ